jgi:hypothetical protein
MKLHMTRLTNIVIAKAFETECQNSFGIPYIQKTQYQGQFYTLSRITPRMANLKVGFLRDAAAHVELRPTHRLLFFFSGNMEGEITASHGKALNIQNDSAWG